MKIILNWILPILAIIIGAYLQVFCVRDICLAFPRSGSLLVVLGIIIESKYVLRIFGDQVYSGAETMTIGKAPHPKNAQERIERFVAHIGLVWVIVGTLIWGFGDLL